MDKSKRPAQYFETGLLRVALAVFVMRPQAVVQLGAATVGGSFRFRIF